MDITIKPKNKIKGEIQVPGDKSISHRSIMLGAIAEGDTLIHGLLKGEDVLSTWKCMEQMGIQIEEKGNQVIVHGQGLKGLKKPESILDAGNSGTTMRLLSGILAAQSFETTLTGDASLQKRPMKRIADPLSQMGADIKLADNNRPPIQINGTKLKPITYHSPVASAQVKSCVLLAGCFTKGKTTVVEPAQSRDHSERMLEAFGVSIHKEELSVSVDGPVQLKGTEIQVPGDISSAAYFLGAAILIDNSDVLLKNVNINPTRTGILEVFEKMGCQIEYRNQKVLNNEPVADLKISKQHLKGTMIEGDIIPKLIDEIPLIAIVATQAEGETIIRNAKELRVKETDRIRTIAENLNKMGVDLEIFEDGFKIYGPKTLQGANIQSFGDHRIAMSFAIAGFIAKGETVIQDAACAAISFPDFFDLLEDVTYA